MTGPLQYRWTKQQQQTVPMDSMSCLHMGPSTSSRWMSRNHQFSSSFLQPWGWPKDLQSFYLGEQFSFISSNSFPSPSHYFKKLKNILPSAWKLAYQVGCQLRWLYWVWFLPPALDYSIPPMQTAAAAVLPQAIRTLTHRVPGSSLQPVPALAVVIRAIKACLSVLVPLESIVLDC